MIPSGLTSMSSGKTGCSSASAASLEKASVESPWKERDQSTCRLPSSRTMGSSLRPLVRSGKSDEGRFGSRGEENLDVVDACCGALEVGLGLDGAESARWSCCAWWTLVDVNAVRAVDGLVDVVGGRVVFRRVDRRGLRGSKSWVGFVLLGRDVEKEMAKVREVRQIWSCQLARWRVRVAIVDRRRGSIYLRIVF